MSDWINKFDLPVDFTCPSDKFLAGTHSYHWNDAEDRRFKFNCCSARFSYENKFYNLGWDDDCEQTNWVNNWDRAVRYNSPDGIIMMKVHSKHWNSTEDRRFKFKSCKPRIK